MRLIPTSDLALRAVPATPDEVPRCQLLVDGVLRGPLLDGVILEAQFAFGTERLVLITHDCIFEEQLDILLFDDHFQVVDQISLGVMYAAGIVDEIDARGDAVEFGFFGGDRWRVTVLAEPLRMAALLTAGARRPVRRWWRKNRLRIARLV